MMADETLENRAAPVEVEPAGFGAAIRRVPRPGWSIVGLPIVIVVMIIYFSSQSEVFFTVDNFENLGRALAALALLATGQAFVIVLGEIDISVGAIVGLTTVTAALAIEQFGVIGFAAAPLTGLAVGLVNGTIVAWFLVHSVIVTIGTLTAVRGLAFLITGGQPVTGDFPAAFEWIGIGTVGPFPAPLIIAVIGVVIAAVALRYTPLGPSLYATGGNEEAARLAGLNVRAIKVTAFMISGTLAGIAGLILAARINSGQPNLGEGLELQAIAAAVIGGMALAGGRGTLGGVILGVLVLGILQNGLDITNVSSFLQQVISGVVILAAVVIDSLRNRPRAAGTLAGAAGALSSIGRRQSGGQPPPGGASGPEGRE
jgi:ribose transport system permease protein